MPDELDQAIARAQAQPNRATLQITLPSGRAVVDVPIPFGSDDARLLAAAILGLPEQQPASPARSRIIVPT